MATKEEIQLIIKTQSDKATKEMKAFNKTLKGSETQTKKTATSYVNMGIAAVGVQSVLGELTEVLVDSVQAASDLEEQTNKFNVVFRDVKSEAQAMANTLRDSYGLSRRESVQLLASTGDLLAGFGFTGEASLEMSGKVQELAADLASFNNVQGGTARASEILTKGILGEREGFKQLGFSILESDVTQKLYEKGLTKLTGRALLAAKAQITYQLAIERSGNSIGDAIQTADSFANVQRRLKARTEDLKAALGSQLLPELQKIGLEFLRSTGDGENFARQIGKTIVLIVRLAQTANSAFNLLKRFNPLSALQEGAKDIISGKNPIKGIGEEFKKLTADVASVTNEIKNWDKINKTATSNFNAAAEQRKAQIQAEIEANKTRSKQSKGAAKDAKKRAEELLEVQRAAITAFADLRDSDQEKQIAKAEEVRQQILEAKVLGDEEIQELERLHQEKIKEIKGEFREADRESQLASFQAFVSNTQQVAGRVQAIFAQLFKNQTLSLGIEQRRQRGNTESFWDAQIAAAAAAGEDTTELERLKTEALADLEEQQAKESAKLQRKQAKLQKKLAVVAAIINTAQGVSAALGIGPVGIPLAALIGALGAVQVGLIASQPIPAAQDGALIPGSAGGTLVNAGENNRAEAIIPLENDEVTERLGGALGGGGTVIINIENLNGNEDLPRDFVEAIDRGLTQLNQDSNSTFAEELS